MLVTIKPLTSIRLMHHFVARFLQSTLLRSPSLIGTTSVSIAPFGNTSQPRMSLYPRSANSPLLSMVGSLPRQRKAISSGNTILMR
jgi:hypothetical protein